MTRTIVFHDGEIEANNFALFYNAFILGGNAIYRQSQGARPNTERRQESRVIKAMNAISTEVDAATKQRKLMPNGGTLVLEQGLFLMVEKYLEAATIPTEASEQFVDLLDRVSAADKVEPTTASDARE